MEPSTSCVQTFAVYLPSFQTSILELLNRYRSVFFSGESITDDVLAQAAQSAGMQWRQCSIYGSSKITDTGLMTLLESSPNLTMLHLHSCASIQGDFVSALQVCNKSLVSLTLEYMTSLDWGELQYELSNWSASNLESLHLHRVNMEEDALMNLFPQLPNLTSLTLDGPPSNLQAAAQCWSVVSPSQ